MASNEDLSEQLALTQKLTAQIERMANAVDRVERSYSQQVEAIQQLAGVFDTLSTDGAVQKIEVLAKALQGVQDKAKKSGQTTTSEFQKLGKGIDGVGGMFKDKFPKSVLIASGALTGFVQGVKNVIAMTKAVTGFFGGLIDGLVGVATSIIAIPFKLFEGLVDFAAKASAGSTELAQAIEDLRKQFGQLGGPTNKAIVNVSTTLKGFKDTGLSAWRVFGDLAKRLNDLRELATEMGGTFGKLTKSFEDNGGAILAYQKGLGISNEDMKGMAVNAIAMGEDVTVALKDMTKQSYALGKAFGLDAKLISRDMSKAMTDVKHFGGATVKQIAEASTYARKLGFELKDITGTLDAFETFDSAAENAAKLSQSFGLNIDAFQMMEAQSPAEQLDMLRKSFRDAGVDASNFNRAQLKLVAGTTGLSEAAVKQGLSMKNEGMRLDEIKKKSGEAEKKTLTQAEAMGQLAGAIERLVQQGGAQTGSFWDMFVKGFLGGLQGSKEFAKMIWNIKRSLQETYLQGVRLGKAFVEMFPGVKDIFGSLASLFEPGKFRKMVGGVVDVVKEFMNDLTGDGGRASFATMTEKIQKVFFNFLDLEAPAGQRLLLGVKKFFGALSTVAAKGIDWASEKIVEGVRYIVDLISGDKSLDSLMSSTTGGLGFLNRLLEPLIKSLKHAWKRIKPELHKLLKKLYDLAIDWVWNHKLLFLGIGTAIMGYIFASSLVGAATNALAGVVVQAAGGLLAPAVGSLLKGVGAKALGQMFEQMPTEGVTKSISKYLQNGFGKSTGGIDVGSKVGDSAANAMGGKADSIGGKIGGAAGGKMSAAGNAMSALAIAAIAYAAYELGKKLIDAHFEAVDKADKARRAADLAASQAAHYGDKDDVSAAIAAQKARIAKQEKENEMEKYSLGVRAAKAGIGLIGGVDLNAEKMRQLAMEKKTLAELEQKQADVLAGKKKYAEQPMGATPSEMPKPAFPTTSDFVGATSIDDAKEKLKSIEELSKKLNGKNFNIEKLVDNIKEKFQGISFEILSPEQAGSLGLGEAQLKQFQGYAETLKNAMVDMKSSMRAISETSTALGQKNSDQISASVSKNLAIVSDVGEKLNESINDQNLQGFDTNVMRFISVIKGENSKSGITGALNAVSEMVKQVNDLNNALSDGNLNKIDIKTKLGRVAKSVGLGSKSTYTVNPSKEVVINLNLHVTMDAGLVERVIIERKESIIRDRLNFATSTPNEKGNSTVSDTLGATPKEIKPGGTR